MREHVSKNYGRRLLLFVSLLSVLLLSSCIESDWKLRLNSDGSGTAEIKFINESLPTENFKSDLEHGNRWIAKLYRMGAKAETGKEGGRDYVLYRVAFRDVSELSDDDLIFSFVQNDRNCEFTLSPTVKARENAWQALPIHFRLSVAMPGRIIDAGSGKRNGDVVTFDTSLADLLAGKTTVRVRSEMPIFLFPSKNIGSRELGIILGILLFLLVGVIGTLMLFKARRRKAAPLQVAPGPTRFCSYCGATVSLSARFCGHCGRPLEVA